MKKFTKLLTALLLAMIIALCAGCGKGEGTGGRDDDDHDDDNLVPKSTAHEMYNGAIENLLTQSFSADFNELSFVLSQKEVKGESENEKTCVYRATENTMLKSADGKLRFKGGIDYESHAGGEEAESSGESYEFDFYFSDGELIYRFGKQPDVADGKIDCEIDLNQLISELSAAFIGEAKEEYDFEDVGVTVTEIPDGYRYAVTKDYTHRFNAALNALKDADESTTVIDLLKDLHNAIAEKNATSAQVSAFLKAQKDATVNEVLRDAGINPAWLKLIFGKEIKLPPTNSGDQNEDENNNNNENEGGDEDGDAVYFSENGRLVKKTADKKVRDAKIRPLTKKDKKDKKDRKDKKEEAKDKLRLKGKALRASALNHFATKEASEGGEQEQKGLFDRTLGEIYDEYLANIISEIYPAVTDYDKFITALSTTTVSDALQLLKIDFKEAQAMVAEAVGEVSDLRIMISADIKDSRFTDVELRLSAGCIRPIKEEQTDENPDENPDEAPAERLKKIAEKRTVKGIVFDAVTEDLPKGTTEYKLDFTADITLKDYGETQITAPAAPATRKVKAA